MRVPLHIAMVASLASMALASTACDEPKIPGRPVPTPGPWIVVRESTSRLGAEDVERGERIRFAVIGTGTGTRFDAGTFLHSPAFEELQVVAVESSARLLAQGLVSLGAGEGWKDLAAVSGDELAVAPWAFHVQPTRVTRLGEVPCDSVGASETDANVLDPAGDFDVYEIFPPTDAVRTLLVRAHPGADMPADSRLAVELFDARGRMLDASDGPCASTQVRSRSPIYARISERGGRGGPAYRYHVTAGFGHPAPCVGAEVPVPSVTAP